MVTDVGVNGLWLPVAKAPCMLFSSSGHCSLSLQGYLGDNYRVRVKLFGGSNLVALEEGGEFGSYPENFANTMKVCRVEM